MEDTSFDEPFPIDVDIYICANGMKSGYKRTLDNPINIQNLVIDIDSHSSNLSIEELNKHILKFEEKLLDSIPFALLLAFQLGLRVSELIALKWSDIKDNTIYVQRQEICYTTHENGKKRTIHEIVEYTKTKAGDRILPLSPEAVSILDDVREWNKEHHITSEFIFADRNGNHFKRQRINDRLYGYCEKANVIKKSTHKIRRCVVSTLLDNVKNKDSVRMFAGHENIQTTFNAYYKDISSDEDFFKEMCACL